MTLTLGLLIFLGVMALEVLLAIGVGSFLAEVSYRYPPADDEP